MYLCSHMITISTFLRTVYIINAVYTQDFSFKRRNTPYYTAILSCSYKLIIQISYSNHLLAKQYSLSRREESCKHKLFACLLVCPQRSKKHLFWEIPCSSHKGWPKGFRHRGTRMWGQILGIWYGSVENRRFSEKPWIFQKGWPKGFRHGGTRI